MLNALWVAFVLAAAGFALFRTLSGDAGALVALVRSTFDSAKLGFEIALGLTGVMTLWLGLMRVGEKAGFVQGLTRVLNPLFGRLFPAVPRGHPALGAMTLNVSANMLGLDNAATPVGLKAMRELQTLNPTPRTATDAQVLFLVINASSVTLLPVSIFTYRAQMGAADPTDVFVPILIATYCSTLVGLLAVAAYQKINLLDRVVLTYLGAVTLAVVGLVAYFAALPAAAVGAQSALLSNGLILALIVAFVAGASWHRVNAYEAFIEGAKDGFKVAVEIIPYLIAMLVAVGLLRASGLLEGALGLIRAGATGLGWDTRWVEAVPTMLMKPLSGSGARAMMIEAMRAHGPDSFAGRLACIVQGSTETTFYVLAVYFGSVGVERARHAVACALLADVAGFAAAIAAGYLFFG